jgi:hypothetical protein
MTAAISQKANRQMECFDPVRKGDTLSKAKEAPRPDAPQVAQHVADAKSTSGHLPGHPWADMSAQKISAKGDAHDSVQDLDDAAP